MSTALTTALCTISVYRNILKFPVLQSANELYLALEEKNPDVNRLFKCYTDFFYTMRDQGFQNLGESIKHLLLLDENPFARACSQGKPDAYLLRAAKNDLKTLNRLAALESGAVKKILYSILPKSFHPVVDDLPDWEKSEPLNLNDLMQSYKDNGYGSFAAGRAFLWENGEIHIIHHPDTIHQSQMIGYEWQREAVIRNTKKLLQGQIVPNVLLYGDSGTGKSATVKSLIHIPSFKNLRVIEIARDGMGNLRRLIQMLTIKPQKFILFIDDISFDRDDQSYSVLKSILEGGLGLRPQNVAVYATSNRRHMVRENFSDRAGDEVHLSETIQEKTSLSDRFGIRIPYLALTKNEFSNLVKRMAPNYDISISNDKLLLEANKWEISHGCRTPRSARQFLEYLSGNSEEV